MLPITLQPKRPYLVATIWLVPIILILLEALLFLRRVDRGSAYLPYFITFWILRAVLAPLIVYYTFRFWVKSGKIARLIFTHLAGFLLFSFIFWALAFLIMRNFLMKPELFDMSDGISNIQVFAVIADNSVSVNIMVYVSTVFICYIWEYLKRYSMENKKAIALENSLNVSRLELLKSQLDTHFLFNTLHTISSLVIRKQNDDANKMIINLSDLLRFSLKENKEQLIPLYREMELLKIYLDIQQARFKERLTVNFKIDDFLDNAMIPPFILQPIIENAVKYAVEPFISKGQIDIEIRKHAGMLGFRIRDNGKTPFADIDFESGIGLNNTKERLRQLYPQQSFQILPNPSGEGVVISFYIPFQPNDNGTTENIDS